MRNRLGPMIALARSARGVAPESRRSASRALVAQRAGTLTRQFWRRASRGQVRLVELSLGSDAADRYFWGPLRRSPVWVDVQQRLEKLDRSGSRSEVTQFVRASLLASSDPNVIIGLARHPLSSEIVAAFLRAANETDEFGDRLEGDGIIAGAFAGAARHVLEPHEADEVIARCVELCPLPNTGFFEVLDSVSYRSAPHRGDDAAAFRPHDNRLVITESAHDVDMVALLLVGSKRSSLIATSDTFGKADFEPYREWPGTGALRVEHIRSRVTRFSQAYIDLHEATAAWARQACDRLAGTALAVHPLDRPFLEVEIADFIFFQALKVRALDLLVADEAFDRIVVALSTEGAGSEFFNLLTHVDGLLDDPRLEIASISRSARVRARFWTQLDGLLGPPHQTRVPFRQPPFELACRKLDAEAERVSSSLPRVSPSWRPRVVVLTTNNPAYNSSTAAYACELQKSFEVEILHVGRNATELVGHLDALGGSNIPVHFIALDSGRVGVLGSVFVDAVLRQPHDTPTRDAERAAASAAMAGLDRLSRMVVAPSLTRMRAMRHWLDRLAQQGELPDAIVMTPHRAPGVSSVVPAARVHGVPTIVLEPHVQDANYSRYLKVAADRYGVVSHYFAGKAAEGLGVPADRVSVVGSPRLVVPPGYDPVTAQRRARAAYDAEHDVTIADDDLNLVFFCQPSDWSHVTKVWGNVLEAARVEGCRVLLKTHPEDSEDRARQYLEQAAELGMAGRVVRLDGDASTAIALGDITLTAYSTAAFDAVIRQKPVICVTDGDVDYPVDLPAIIETPIVRSAAELARLLTEFRTDPEPFVARSKAFLEREQQFVDGPGERVRALVADAVAAGSKGVRPEAERLTSLFLDGPHPVFKV